MVSKVKDELVIKESNGEDITISVMGSFKVESLGKEYIMYSLVDDNPNNMDGIVMIGEVLRDGESVEVVGIKDEEKDIVLSFYKEISDQLGE